MAVSCASAQGQQHPGDYVIDGLDGTTSGGEKKFENFPRIAMISSRRG